MQGCWFEDDICWCNNSQQCKHEDCFRNLRQMKGEYKYFTISNLQGTELCPYAYEFKEKKGEKS